MKPHSQVVFLRYWGSHFKSEHQVAWMGENFRPLVSRGWRCVLVLERRPENPGWLATLDQLRVQIEYLPRPRSNFDWRGMRRAQQLCRRWKPDLMVCDNIHTPPLVGAWLARVPVRLWWKRAMNPHFEQCRAPTFRDRLAPSLHLSCWLASRVMAVSSAVKEELIFFGTPADKILVRRNPRRLGDSRTVLDRAQARSRWGFSPEDVVVSTVGRAVPVKGWDLLAQAFGVVANADSRARLLLAGSCSSADERPFFEELVRWLARHRLQGRVTFAGHLTDVRPALAAADLFVLPSRSEGCANALIEAMEARLPCVATRVGAAGEVIETEKNGLLVDRADVESLAAALLTLVRDDDLRIRFARCAAVPPSVPSLEQYAEQVACDYESLLRTDKRSCR